MAKNVAWGLGSRGFSSLASVAYLGIAARSLGPELFGGFVLILTYGQMIANLVQFQSWKGVIRYGSLHVAADRQDRLGRLFGFTATLDFASALTGALLAAIGVAIVAPLFDWTAEQQTSAALFGAVLLLSTGATATGMLRLFDRFDLIAFAEGVGPLVRLAGSIIAWLVGATVDSLLVIWACAAIAQGAAQWVAALLVNRSRLALGPRHFRQAVNENQGVWRFMLQTNVSNSISLFWMQLGTLAIGAVSGASEAGAFRLAQRISKGIVRPVRPVTVALYPELSRLVAEDNHAKLRSVMIRVTLAAAAIASVVVVVTAVAGSQIINLIAGKEFQFAYVFLLLLSVAAAIDLAGFALEPLQDAHGRSWNVLRARLVAAGGYAVLLFILLPEFGAQGAAIAAIICSLLIFIQLAWGAMRVLRQPKAQEAPDGQ